MFAIEENISHIKASARMLRPPHIEMEDAEQEITIRCWRTWHTYKAERGTVAAWIYAVAKQAMADKVRYIKTKRRSGVTLSLNQKVDGVDLYEFVDSIPVPEVDVPTNLVVCAALRKLPPRWRTALYLRFWHDMTHAEVAQRFGVGRTAPQKWEKQALARLRKLLAKAV